MMNKAREILTRFADASRSYAGSDFAGDDYCDLMQTIRVGDLRAAARALANPPFSHTKPTTNPPSGDWQPIETAPKDGTWFLGYWPDSPMCWAPYELISWVENEDGTGYYCDQDTSEPTECTHWMPLPEPPKTSA